MSKVVQDIIRLINSNPEKYKVELQQMIAESSLVNYVELMWHILEPSRKFCRGWHIDCICDHLSAIAYGEIHKLLINVPPGSSKPVYEESRVITKNGCKTLKEVVVGDEILTHMGRFRKVNAVHVQGELPTLTIHTYNGRELTLAFDHPVLTTRGWVQAKDLTLNDQVCVVTSSCKENNTNNTRRQSFDSIWLADKIVGIKETGLKKCRCLTVDEDHSFTANDIAVHNSLLTRVFFPSWIWGPKNMPYTQFLGFSYAQSLSERDNVKFRKLIQSPEYKSIWGDRFSLVKDTNNKRKFSNNKNGFSEATSTDGTGTGLRADVVVIDDPHSVKQANSDADLNRALLWFRETLPTRVNSLENSATVVIMQRVSERDVSGEILSNDLGYEHVMIPMMFEPERKCYTVVHPGGHKAKDGSLYLWDKREKEGDLMCPELFPEKAVAKLVQTLGSYATAGQLQQRPVPREGALFKTSDIQYIDFENVPEGIEVRGWDLAGSSSSKSPFTAGAKLRFDSRGNFYIMDVLRFRGAEKRVVTIMRNTAEKDGIECIQDFPQDPGQAGKGQAVFITEQLAGYVAKSSVETGSKTLRADAMATQASIGKMFIVKGPWNKEFVDELTTFPGSRFKDQVDACSRAFHQGLKLMNLDNDENICAPVSI